jgi:hypothetical protein
MVTTQALHVQKLGSLYSRSERSAILFPVFAVTKKVAVINNQVIKYSQLNYLVRGCRLHSDKFVNTH